MMLALIVGMYVCEDFAFFLLFLLCVPTCLYVYVCIYACMNMVAWECSFDSCFFFFVVGVDCLPACVLLTFGSPL